MHLFTIGHSNHSLEAFMALLHQHQITALADVRSHPYSRYLPHFSQAPLKAALQQAAIEYVFLGRELGARPHDPSCYDEQGKALYERIATSQAFQAGIQRVLKGAANYRIALMCAEKDPIACHRAILVCQALRQTENGSDLLIHHILSDGELESHEALEQRLLAKHDLIQSPHNQLSLFDPGWLDESTKSDLEQNALQEAYRRQGDRIAYVERQAESPELPEPVSDSWTE